MEYPYCRQAKTDSLVGNAKGGKMRINTEGVSVARDDRLISTIASLFTLENKPRIVIETGTYHGTGTTQMIIQALHIARATLITYTLEADQKNYLTARENLAGNMSVKVLHGTSVDVEQAVSFMKSDPFLLWPNDHPDILYDSENPVEFYTRELLGSLPAFGGTGIRGENNIFSWLVPPTKGMNPLFVLDSCGGIGFFEFQEVCRHMDGNHFFLWCHDIDHIKHHRTFKLITHEELTDSWNVLDKTDKWVLAEYNP